MTAPSVTKAWGESLLAQGVDASCFVADDTRREIDISQTERRLITRKIVAAHTANVLAATKALQGTPEATGTPVELL